MVENVYSNESIHNNRRMGVENIENKPPKLQFQRVFDISHTPTIPNSFFLFCFPVNGECA